MIFSVLKLSVCDFDDEIYHHSATVICSIKLELFHLHVCMVINIMAYSYTTILTPSGQDRN